MKTETVHYQCDICHFKIDQKDIIEFVVDNGDDYSGAPSCSFVKRHICDACLIAANLAAELKREEQ